MFSMDEATQRAIKKYPHRAKDIAQSFSQNQIRSKQWLVRRLTALNEKNTIDCNISKINVVGGWFGNQLIPNLLELYPKASINFYEIDNEAIKIARGIYFNKNKRIKFHCVDATEVNFSGNSQMTINTSSEHMDDLNITNSIYAIQSNNYYSVPEHINCVDNVEQLQEKNKFKKVWYADSKHFGKQNYDRFMVIGRV